MDTLKSLHNDLEGDGCETPMYSRRSSVHISRKTSWGTPIPAPSANTPSIVNVGQGGFFDSVVIHATDDHHEAIDNEATWNTVENIAALGLAFSGADSPSKHSVAIERFLLEEPEPKTSTRPQPISYHRFDKWMKTLQRKSLHRRQTVGGDVDIVTRQRDSLHADAKIRPAAPSHRKSLSGSSMGFVTAVKSASISLASFSVAPRSRRADSRHQRTDHSSRTSNAGVRLSEDSACLAKVTTIDEEVQRRAIQRRQVLEEIISTEESYIADVKFLMNVRQCSFREEVKLIVIFQVYVTLLASIPTISMNLRLSINQNLVEIVELHEELLGDLHRVVPHSEYSQASYTLPPVVRHRRLRSIDSISESSRDLSWLQGIPGLMVEASIAAEVAKVFGKKVSLDHILVNIVTCTWLTFRIADAPLLHLRRVWRKI